MLIDSLSSNTNAFIYIKEQMTRVTFTAANVNDFVPKPVGLRQHLKTTCLVFASPSDNETRATQATTFQSSLLQLT